uniref:CDC42 effector protein (Rho GTPase binding) 5 n=1 Tax=Seriola dumerili TaxID=41447 RepID=A0A3B4U0F7_SERDU
MTILSFFFPPILNLLAVMPLHKSSRAPRLDPTMISAPLGDFRHTMHIGRGGDAFGDTSFLSTLGPSPASPDLGSPGIMPAADPEVLQHSESVSSFTLDLDLDLGPSMLGDVLGVMDGLGLESNEGYAFSPKSGTSSVETKPNQSCSQNAVILYVFIPTKVSWGCGAGLTLKCYGPAVYFCTCFLLV